MTDVTTGALRLIKAALGEHDPADERAYLAFLAAANALHPISSRTDEIVHLREKLGL